MRALIKKKKKNTKRNQGNWLRQIDLLIWVLPTLSPYRMWHEVAMGFNPASDTHWVCDDTKDICILWDCFLSSKIEIIIFTLDDCYDDSRSWCIWSGHYIANGYGPLYSFFHLRLNSFYFIYHYIYISSKWCWFWISSRDVRLTF